MVDVYSQKEVPFDGENFIGVVVTGDETQRHAGIYYNTGIDNSNHFLHLAFHYRLRRDNPESSHCWLPLDGFDIDEKLSIAIWIDSIWNTNHNRVPYGINYSNSIHFNNTGAWTASADDGGLTCATFILAIFSDFGFPLVDTASSIRRDSDQIWQSKILETLSNFAPPEYIEKQRNHIGQSARYRPEEVVGAASLYSGNAVQFDAAIEVGELVLRKLLEFNAP